jgi:aminoglycoside phosphotransferase (APT) family kinase protein
VNSPWSAECAVTPDCACALIEAQFPKLAPVVVEPLGAGWDNTAYLVNGAYVFRFPRRKSAVKFFEAETRLLPVIAPQLPVSVPVPNYLGGPTPEFDWPFAGYPLLAGRTACTADLNAEHRVRIAPALGHFLATLHSASTAAVARQRGAGPDPIDRLNPVRALPRARELLDRLSKQGLIDAPKPLAALLDAAPVDYVPRTDTLVHGDLYARHLLVDEANGLAGVIDWGDVHLGDPALDLTIVLTFLPPVARPGFCEAYGDIGEVALLVAACRAVGHTLHVLDYAHAIGDEALLGESRRSLSHLTAR